MVIRGDYYNECVDEINRRICYIEELEDQFKLSVDYGIDNCKSEEDVREIFRRGNKKLDTMRDEIHRAKYELTEDVSDIGGWV